MSQQGPYNELKPAWWFAKEGKLPDAPKQVQLILSDLCNQDCHFCAYRLSNYTSNELFMGDSEPAAYGHDNPNRTMDTERALSLLDEFKEAGVLAVQFTGGGEPLVHKDHEVIFEKCLSLGLRASLVTNGVRMSKHLIREILPRFDWVRISIDAGSADTYAETRRTSRYHWDSVWQNIAKLVYAVRMEKQTGCTVGLGFVVTPWSWSEIGSFIEKAKASGVDNARLTAMFSPDDETPFEDIYEKIVSVITAAREECEGDGFTVYDNFGSRFADMKQHSPDYSYCTYQYFTTYVGGDLNAYRCCVQSYSERGKIAGMNLKNESFAKFWKSDERKQDFQSFDARGCERCQFNSKNRAVNYLMSDDPLHKEWT